MQVCPVYSNKKNSLFKWMSAQILPDANIHHVLTLFLFWHWIRLIKPCSKCLVSWHQIRKGLRQCLHFAYAHTGFACMDTCLTLSLRWLTINRVLLTPHPYKGAPSQSSQTWTQGFRTWLNWLRRPNTPNSWPSFSWYSACVFFSGW